MTRPVDKLIDHADSILRGETETLEDWRDALQLYTQAAAMGSGRAFSKIGDFYINGKYVKKSIEKSLDNYKKSAEIGDSFGYFGLADVYQDLEDNQNLVKIFKLFVKKFIETEDELKYQDMLCYINIFVFLTEIFEKIDSAQDRDAIVDNLLTAIFISDVTLEHQSKNGIYSSVFLHAPVKVMVFANKFHSLSNEGKNMLLSLEVKIKDYQLKII